MWRRGQGEMKRKHEHVEPEGDSWAIKLKGKRGL